MIVSMYFVIFSQVHIWVQQFCWRWCAPHKQFYTSQSIHQYYLTVLARTNETIDVILFKNRWIAGMCTNTYSIAFMLYIYSVEYVQGDTRKSRIPNTISQLK